jgi:hypothetical protein
MKSCIIGLLLAFASCERYADPATYILPNAYKGPFVVVYSQPLGLPTVYRHGRRWYEIPANGILATRFNYQDGWRDDVFLMKHGNGYDTLGKWDTVRAVSFRSFEYYYPKWDEPDQKHHLDSAFMYEVVAIVRQDTVQDDSMRRWDGWARQMIDDLIKHRSIVK